MNPFQRHQTQLLNDTKLYRRGFDRLTFMQWYISQYNKFNNVILLFYLLVKLLSRDIRVVVVLGDVPLHEGQSVFGEESNQEHYKIQVTKKGNRYYDENGVRFYICKQCSYKNTNHRALGGHVQKKHRYQVDKKITKPQISQF